MKHKNNLMASMLTAAVTVATVGSLPAWAQPKLNNAFGDHMVLQRSNQSANDKTVIWGMSSPGANVVASVAGVSGEATADATGKFRVVLDDLKAGGPHTLVVSDATGKVEYSNVLIGDVYFASGQSNMEWRLNSTKNAAMEIADSTHPTIRLLLIRRATSVEGPKTDVTAKWSMCDPTTTPEFSAVAYFFGRELQTAVMEDGKPVPIGLVQGAWGGTAAEVWTPRAALENHEMFAQRVKDADAGVARYPEARKAWEQSVKEWDANSMQTDPGDPAGTGDLAAADFDDSSWKTMTQPKRWEDDGLAIDGAVWFRKEFFVDAATAAAGGDLLLPAIDDCDVTYINGAKVGETPPSATSMTVARKYEVKPGVLKAGRNVVAVRVFDRSQMGGFVSWIGSMKLVAGNTEIDLSGAWKYLVTVQLAPRNAGPRPPEPIGPNSPAVPATLYNAMVAPVIDMSLKGVIWYQGESNAGRAEAYATLFPLMINQWREKFGRNEPGDELPFLWVQLANYTPAKPEPGESDWAELREAQTKTLSLPKTGQAVTIDIGEARDIHPRNKQDVGKRLALAAMKVVYGMDVVYSGPMYEQMNVDGGKIRLSFEHAAGLNAKGGKPTGFAIAGSDRKWVWAEAKIEGNEVVVWSDAVKEPVAVRYGWATNPQEGPSTANLYNAAGLPASPFRTDDWPGVTVGKR